MKAKIFISKYEEQTYAILRIVLGFLFLWHGSQKLLNYPPLPPGIKFPLYVLSIAGPIEFLGGIFMVAGFLTQWTAFICSGEMAFAYWIGHGTHALLPLVNHGELAMIYCFLFLFISSKGSGIFSIDHYFKKKADKIHLSA
jgi:putative oxidoreductase